MTNFRDLKKLAKTLADGDLRVAVVGDCATQLLTVAVKGALAARGIGAQVFETEYNQVSRQILAADSDLRRFNPAMTIVWESVERWWVSDESVAERIDRVRQYAQSFPGRLLYLNAASFDDGVFGNFAATEVAFSVKIRAFNAALDALCGTCKNLDIIDLNTLVATLGRNVAYTPSLYMTADLPLSLDALAVLAERIGAVVAARHGKVRKCVILDLDNTLWGGVIGEDGLDGIKLGEHDVGKAFTLFQRFLLRLKRRGIILAVCSKNDEAIAKEPFARHPEMVLRLEDIACFVANWQTKADNVAHIQKVLNIGFDSLVFLDDNPAEREIVRLAHAEVAVPELPTDPAEWIPFLAATNLFETVSYSSEDADRTKTYQEEAKRRAWQATFASEAEFLKGLQMTASVSPFDSFSIPRAAQLTQRSNQFNLRTQRYSEADLEAFATRDDVETFVFKLADKFGDYGIVSVIIGIVQGDALFLDTWLMSCRVLKRGLEQFALNAVVERARHRGLARIVGEYLPTRKNAMVAGLLDESGFVLRADGRSELDTARYLEKENFIERLFV